MKKKLVGIEDLMEENASHNQREITSGRIVQPIMSEPKSDSDSPRIITLGPKKSSLNTVSPLPSNSPRAFVPKDNHSIVPDVKKDLGFDPLTMRLPSVISSQQNTETSPKPASPKPASPKLTPVKLNIPPVGRPASPKDDTPLMVDNKPMSKETIIDSNIALNRVIASHPERSSPSRPSLDQLPPLQTTVPLKFDSTRSEVKSRLGSPIPMPDFTKQDFTKQISNDPPLIIHSSRPILSNRDDDIVIPKCPNIQMKRLYKPQSEVPVSKISKEEEAIYEENLKKLLKSKYNLLSEIKGTNLEPFDNSLPYTILKKNYGEAKKIMTIRKYAKMIRFGLIVYAMMFEWFMNYVFDGIAKGFSEAQRTILPDYDEIVFELADSWVGDDETGTPFPAWLRLCSICLFNSGMFLACAIGAKKLGLEINMFPVVYKFINDVSSTQNDNGGLMGMLTGMATKFFAPKEEKPNTSASETKVPMGPVWKA